MTPDAYVPVARPGIAQVELDGETVLFFEERGTFHVLNPTASLAWRCFDGATSVGEVADALAEAFGVERAEVAAGVLGLVDELARAGLLAANGEAHGPDVAPRPAAGAPRPP